MATATKITVETTVNAPVGHVWEHWTLPRHIIHWNNASDDWHTPSATNDLRTGGNFKFGMAAKNGSYHFDFEGIYDEVVENQRIAYSMADGRQVEITFSGNGQTTKVTETFDPETENSLELQRGGWQAILDNFKKYTEKQ